MRRNIVIYCHDTLAFGHISRMLNIYHVLSQENNVYMMFGGPIPLQHVQGLNYIHLPELEEKNIYLQQEESKKILQKRSKYIQNFLEEFQINTLFIDYFPFGRIALQSEIENMILQIRESNTQVQVYTFMRDIFSAEVPIDRLEYEHIKETILEYFGYPYTYMMQVKYRQEFGYTFISGTYQNKEFLKLLKKESIHPKIWDYLFIEYYFENSIIDKCLVFGDSELHSLLHEFSFCYKVMRNFTSLGYLLPQGREELKNNRKDYILVSLGGAIFDYNIYQEVLEKLLGVNSILIKCVIPFFTDEVRLMEVEKKIEGANVEFIPFNKDYYKLHLGAKACVTGGGYGSFMDLLYNPIPTLIVLNHNSEVDINKTEQYQRYIIFQQYLPVLLYDSSINTSRIYDFFNSPLKKTLLEKMQKVNTNGAENLQKLFGK